MRRVALLCAVAGYVDGFGYLQLSGVFAANMTGNTVLLTIAATRGDWDRVTVDAFTLAAFLLGALAASFLKHALLRPFLALLLAAILLVLAHWPELDGLFALVLLAGAMGLQGAALGRFADISLQTVVVTGTILRLADALVDGFWRRLRSVTPDGSGAAAGDGAAALTAAAWLFYALGVAGGVAGIALLRLPLVVPAALLGGLAIELALTGRRSR